MADKNGQWLERVREAPGPLTIRQLTKHLGILDDQREKFVKWLDGAVETGQMVRNRRGRYAASESFNLFPSTLEVHRRGFAFASIPDHPDLYVAPNDKGGALHGDRVLVRMRRGRVKKGDKPEGEVVRVLERANHRLAGELSKRGRYGLVVPRDPRLTDPVVVDTKDQLGARTGEMVEVEITRWPRPRLLAEGRITERFGMPDAPGVQERVLMASYDLDPEFPPEVTVEAESLDPPTETRGRHDLRDLPVITIDPAGARDHDDALSFERKGDTYRLGVHIADVAHYVKEGGAIDLEALRRGTSVYLVEQVVPMLPPRLSEEICSLREGEDRYCISVFLDYEPGGRLLDTQIVRGIIRVRRDFTYEDVQALIDNPNDSDPASGLIGDLHRLSRRMEQDRAARGSIDFDLPEEDIQLDRLGRPVDINPRPRTAAHRLVENCMLAANEAVGTRYHRLGVPFVYRVHPEPDESRVEDAGEFLSKLGLRLEIKNPIHPGSFQDVLKEVAGRPDERLVTMVLLRAMAVAHYTPKCLGHFALALDRYCHFTSPIRRYPDLMVHRVIGAVLDGKRLSQSTERRWQSTFPQIADQCSKAERRADEVEREAKDIKKAQYMNDRVGDVFDGVISGVTEFGVFVQLPNAVEGLVHVSSLTDDYYVFSEESHSLRGRRQGRRLQLGDPVTVQVMRASVADRRIDFRLA